MLAHRTAINRLQELRRRLFIKADGPMSALILDERAQDIIEYALLVALIALAATASMSPVASAIGTALSKVGSKLSAYTS